jgi:hypothetical protein
LDVLNWKANGILILYSKQWWEATFGISYENSCPYSVVIQMEHDMFAIGFFYTRLN